MIKSQFLHQNTGLSQSLFYHIQFHVRVTMNLFTFKSKSSIKINYSQKKKKHQANIILRTSDNHNHCKINYSHKNSIRMFLSQKILFQLSLLLLLHFSILVLLSLAYTVPDKYFINCGASFNTTINDSRVFVGDQNSCSFSTGESEHVMSSNSSTAPVLYQTARIYRQPCSYKFEINQNGTYLVRLHFFVFLSPAANLSDALFNVSASGFSLFPVEKEQEFWSPTNTLLSLMVVLKLAPQLMKYLAGTV